MGQPVLNIKNFFGMLTMGGNKAIPPDFCFEQQDMIANRGFCKTRPGFSRFDPTAQGVGSLGPLGLFQFRRKNGQWSTISFSDDGKMYDWPDWVWNAYFLTLSPEMWDQMDDWPDWMWDAYFSTVWPEMWEAATPAIYYTDNSEFEADQGTYHFDTNNPGAPTFAQITNNTMKLATIMKGIDGINSALLVSPVDMNIPIAEDTKMTIIGTVELEADDHDYFGTIELYTKKGSSTRILKYMFNYSRPDAQSTNFWVDDIGDLKNRNIYDDYADIYGSVPSGWTVDKIRLRTQSEGGPGVEEGSNITITYNNIIIGQWE